MKSYFLIFSLVALSSCALKNTQSKPQDFTMIQSNLKGHYGFFTDYSAMPEADIRNRVKILMDDFKIREFQFYDWFAGYSLPTSGECWKDAFFKSKDICLTTIKIMIDEIHKRGGRAWAYVQAVGSDLENLENPSQGIYKLRDKNGDWYWHAGKFPTYFANEQWAYYAVDIWADAVKEIGFNGIHWDTLGPIAGDYGAEKAGINAFLKTTSKLLESRGLKQTMNFVNLAWWNDELVLDFVEFPYAEVWSMTKEKAYYELMNSEEFRQVKGVMAFYPSVDQPAGWSQEQVMFARLKEAHKHRLSYLIVGDGNRRLKNEYFPGAVVMDVQTHAALKEIMSSHEPLEQP